MINPGRKHPAFFSFDLNFRDFQLWLIADGVADTVIVDLDGKTIRIRLKSSSDELLSYSDLLYEVIDLF